MITPEESIPLKTPVISNRHISSIGKGKVSWITWKNATFAGLWLLFSALIGFLTVQAVVWVRAIVFGCIAVPGLAFFLIPVKNKPYYWVYNYVIDIIRFAFARNANNFPDLGSTSDFIPFDKIVDNKLFMKGTESVQAFYRINGRNIYSSAREVQLSLLGDFHTLLRNLNGMSIKIVGFQTNFNLIKNAKHYADILNDDKNIITSFLPIAAIEWQNYNFRRNFKFYKDSRESIPAYVHPRDMVYLLVISADSEQILDMMCQQIVPNLTRTDPNLVEPADTQDIINYIRKQFGNTAINPADGLKKIKDNAGREILQITPQITNMKSLKFLAKYWEVKDYSKVNAGSKRHYHKIISINNFNADASLGWLDCFFEDPGINCMQIKFEEFPLNKQSKLVGKAIKQYSKVEQKSGEMGAFDIQRMQTIFDFLNSLQEETGHLQESLIKTTFYIKIEADNLKSLNEKEMEIKYRLKRAIGLTDKEYDSHWFKQRDVFLSSLAVKLDVINKKLQMNLLSTAIAIGWPFNNPRLIQKNGFLIGFASNGLSPVCLDFSSQRSFSGMIVGKTGSGKSLLAKLITLQLLLDPKNKIFWFDPENEMASMGSNINAIQVDLTSETPIVDKIEFSQFMKRCLENTIEYDDHEFLDTYYALLDVLDGYKFLSGASNDELRNMSPQERQAKGIVQTPLIQESIDYFGEGSLQKHSRQVYVTNWQITPTAVKDQILMMESEIAKKCHLRNPKLLYKIYGELYKWTIHSANINPYRIILSTDEDSKQFNAFGLYNNHRKLLLSWFKELMPKADVNHTTWFTSTLNKLYKKFCNIIETKEDNNLTINLTVKDIITRKEYPTLQDHYDILMEEYQAFIHSKPIAEFTPAEKTKIKKMDEVLTVFDNLVVKNRYNERGLFYYLWTKDNDITFTKNKQMLIFNIQNLLTHVKSYKEADEYTNAVRFDFQNVFNAQYYLSQQVIWSHVVTNRMNNDVGLGKTDAEKTHVYIFMDEAHASLKQPQFVDWSVNMIKRARKYSSGIWLITQSIGDYLKLTDAQELFNNFNFKFFLQSEALAFRDILNKFETSNVPLTHYEETWLNPILGATTQGRGILAFSDAMRYLINVSTSTEFIRNILERNLIDNRPFIQNHIWFGNGVQGWLNYLRSSPADIKASLTDKILETTYKRWTNNNLKKFDHALWQKQKLHTAQMEKSAKEIRDELFAKEVQASREQALDRTKGRNK